MMMMMMMMMMKMEEEEEEKEEENNEEEGRTRRRGMRKGMRRRRRRRRRRREGGEEEGEEDELYEISLQACKLSMNYSITLTEYGFCHLWVKIISVLQQKTNSLAEGKWGRMKYPFICKEVCISKHVLSYK